MLLLRDTIGMTLIVSSIWWSGPLVQQAGYGDWVVGFALAWVLPLVVCSVAFHVPIAFGAMAATALTVSIHAYHPSY